jgi:hypothetical protein
VLQRQSAEVDYVTGATESANAFYYGIVEALDMAEAAGAEPPATVPAAPVSGSQ